MRKSTQAARALAALRKRKGPKPVRRWRCLDCGTLYGTNEMRRHWAVNVECVWCGEQMTRSQTRTHKCEAVDRRAK